MEKDFDYDEEDLEELDPDENAGSDSDDFDYDDDDIAEETEIAEDEDDSSFFDESEEDDDLCLGESVARASSVGSAQPPRIPAVDALVRAAEKPGSRRIYPIFFAVPLIAVIVGILVFFLQDKKGGQSMPTANAKLDKEILPSRGSGAGKHKDAGADQDAYVELKRIVITDPFKIIPLVDPSMLEKKIGDSGLSIEKLILTLYKKDMKYAVKQTYRYSDGAEFTVDAPFPLNVRTLEEAVEYFERTYSG